MYEVCVELLRMPEVVDVGCGYRDFVLWTMDRGKSFPMPEEDFNYWVGKFLVEGSMLKDSGMGIIDGKLRYASLSAKTIFQISPSRKETLEAEEFMEKQVRKVKRNSGEDF